MYRVVIDPGHGGISLDPISIHGDRYDPISKRYLSKFVSGAKWRKYEERKIAYSIAKKVMRYLNYCSEDGDFSKFIKIIRKFSHKPYKRIFIKSRLSRPKSLSKKDSKLLKDPNAPYRLFDYPKGDQIIAGRISRINQFHPHMVVSIHLAKSGPKSYQGMSAVVLAPPRLLKLGLKYLRKDICNNSFFHKDKLDHWFIENLTRGPFNWFLNDCSLYFTSYPLHRNRTMNHNKFRGYRYNMVKWSYADGWNWDLRAALHSRFSQYSDDYNSFVLKGNFWERENGKYESYRRDGGIEGYGGDNSYASNEIIRYILMSLKKSGVKLKNRKPGNPYVSIWSMPLHINAINAFFELGYLRRKSDLKIMIEKQDEIAKGIAVGVYSLLSGLKIDKDKYSPKGKSIDFKKYMIDDKKSYFDIVTE